MGRSQVEVADDLPSLSKKGEANYVDASPSTTRERMEIQHDCSMTVSSPKWTHYYCVSRKLDFRNLKGEVLRYESRGGSIATYLLMNYIEVNGAMYSGVRP